MKRREFSPSTKRAAYERAGGRCEWDWGEGRCPFPLVGGGVEYHHVRDSYWGGDNSLENCSAICIGCHRQLTKKDRPRKDKARRQGDRHKGVKKRRTMGYRRFDGTPVNPGEKR